MNTFRAYLNLLCGIAQLVLILIAALSFDHTATFLKLIAWLLLLALYDIEDAIRADRKRSVVVNNYGTAAKR